MTELELRIEELRAELAGGERMLKHFEFAHLPDLLRDTSSVFCACANTIAQTITPGPERTVALRKLLEAKDAAVRATRLPGC